MWPIIFVGLGVLIFWNRGNLVSCSTTATDLHLQLLRSSPHVEGILDNNKHADSSSQTRFARI